MRFSIIVPTISDNSVLLNLIDWFRRINHPDSELVIVDQGLNARDYLCDSETKNIIYSHQTQKGLSRNRNIGVDLSLGEWLIFLDDNCTFDKEFFDILNDVLVENINVDIVFSLIANEFGKLTSRVVNRKVYLNLRTIDYGSAAGMVVRRSVFDEVKFDEKMGTGQAYGSCEEFDFVASALEKNFKVLISPSLLVYHPESETNNLREYNYGRGHGYLVRKRIKAKYNFVSNSIFIFRRIFFAFGKFFYGFCLMLIKKKTGRNKVEWFRGFFHGLFKISLDKI